jgi:hypothetical protein
MVSFYGFYGWSVPSSTKVRRNLDRKFWFGFDVSTLWVPRFIHERNKKEKIPLGLGEPSITYAQVLTSLLKFPPPPN